MTTLVDRLDTWLGRNPAPRQADDPAERFAQLRAWQQRLHAGGWLGLGWPEEYGGRAGTWADQAAVYAHLALRGAPTPVGIIGLQTVGPAVIEHGTAQQKATFLPRILSGDDVWCQGFSEPDAGSDLAALRTSARRGPDGYVVRGQKVWTSWAQYADWCALLVRTGAPEDRHRGLTYLAVPMTEPGITVRPIRQLNGESEFNELFLDDVRVPLTSTIGAENDGWRVALSTLDHERTAYPISRHAELAVQVRTLLDAAPEGAVPDDRRGWLETELLAMGALSRAASRDLARGEAHAWSAGYKMAASQLEQSIAAAALAAVESKPGAWLDAPAGAGLAHTLYLTSRSATIHGGTAQVLSAVLAERNLDLPRSR
jgi:alkylation response protein AidB-like acyl-CoA dehydrogenase